MEEDLLARLLASAGVAVALTGDAGSRAKRASWARRQRDQGLPAVVLHVISDDEGVHMEGADGLSTTRVQVNALGATYAAAKKLARAVRTEFKGASFQQGATDFQLVQVVDGGDLDQGETPDPVFGVTLDLLIKHGPA